jgi:ornithine lipid hydroxylase
VIRLLLRRLLAWVFYPAVLGGSLMVSAELLRRGVSPGSSTTIAFVAALLVVFAVERVQPHERSWNASPREAALDLGYLAIAGATQGVAAGIAQVVGVVTTLALASWLGPKPWPGGWPAWAQALLAFGLADLGKYLLHRLSHERAWLWRFHAAHHAPVRMYSLNGVRLHPVNILWNLVLDIGVSVALGLQGRELALVATFRGTITVLQHANIELRLGPLNWLLSTPTLHQWHHSSELAESNANYGASLIVWDVLFGTRRLSSAGVPAALGLAPGAVHPRRLWHQLVWPWCEHRASTCRWTRG